MSYNFPLPLTSNDKEYLAEIARSNGGENTTAYLWACEGINQAQWKQINAMKAGK